MPEILPSVTFGVSTIGNVEALCMCLASVLAGTKLPNTIRVRFEGKLPSFGSFYLEQLSCLAKLRGVYWEMFIAESQGIRFARDWQIARTHGFSHYLWMGDDDVIYDADCLSNFVNASAGRGFVFMSGIKVDVNNRRNYSDFDSLVYSTYPAPVAAPLNHFYRKDLIQSHAFNCELMDAGNCLLNVDAIVANGYKFQKFATDHNAGGEDTLFAAHVIKTGGIGLVCPSAQAIHLEKPKIFFDDFKARRELIDRSLQCLGI